MSVVQIVAATTDHARFIAANMREADKVELGERVQAKLDALVLESLSDSHWCNCALLDGVPVVIYGVSPTDQNPKWGVPWLLGTEDARKLRKSFIRESRSEVELMLARFSFLYNRVHDQNALCIRWLIWLGFTIAFDQPQQVDGRTFLTFYRGNPHV